MLLYRITREKYLTNFTGRGSSYLNGARWNKPQLPVLYFAPTPSVALLEMANYLPSPRLVPKDYRLGIYELPKSTSIKTLTVADLPSDWAEFPHPISTQTIGSQWLLSKETLCLTVPSAAITEGLENIIIVNPEHPEIENLQLINAVSSLYSKRAFQGIKDN